LEYSRWPDSRGFSDRWYFSGHKPNKASWLVFVGIEIAWLTSACVAGENPLLNIAYVLGNCAILFHAYQLGGESQWSTTDKVCASLGSLAILAGLIAALAGLKVAHHITIGGLCFAYLVGVWPTALSVWKDPRSEPLVAWSLWLFGSIFYLYVEMKVGNADSMAVVITVVLEEVTVPAIIVFRCPHTRMTHT
jgi:hypothetical protein